MTRMFLVLPLALTLGACAGSSPQQASVGTGALGGAALGGLVGSFGGNAGWGALGGAALGAGAGYLYNQSQQDDRSNRRRRR